MQAREKDKLDAAFRRMMEIVNKRETLSDSVMRQLYEVWKMLMMDTWLSECQLQWINEAVFPPVPAEVDDIIIPIPDGMSSAECLDILAVVLGYYGQPYAWPSKMWIREQDQRKIKLGCYIMMLLYFVASWIQHSPFEEIRQALRSSSIFGEYIRLDVATPAPAVPHRRPAYLNRMPVPPSSSSSEPLDRPDKSVNVPESDSEATSAPPVKPRVFINPDSAWKRNHPSSRREGDDAWSKEHRQHKRDESVRREDSVKRSHEYKGRQRRSALRRSSNRGDPVL
jgi:hypothetical protein